MDIEQGVFTSPRSRLVDARSGHSNDDNIITRFTHWFDQLARCLRNRWVKNGFLFIIFLRLLYDVYDAVMIKGVDWSTVFSVNSVLSFVKDIAHGVAKRLLRDIVIVGVILWYITGNTCMKKGIFSNGKSRFCSNKK